MLIFNHRGFINYKNIFEYKITILRLLIATLILIEKFFIKEYIFGI